MSRFMKLGILKWLILFLVTLHKGDSESDDTDATGTDVSMNQIIIGNLEVESPEDGVPSLDTGLYLMSQEAPFDGRIKQLHACSFLLDKDSKPQSTKITLRFYVAGYRLMGDIYKRITHTETFFKEISIGETFACNQISILQAQQPELFKGDQIGVLILEDACNNESINPPTYVCPAHVNIIDPNKNCSQSLFFNNTRLEGKDMPAVLNAFSGHPADIFLNLDVIIEPLSAEEPFMHNNICAERFNPINKRNAAILPIIIVIPTGVILLFMMILIVLACSVNRYCKNRRIKHMVKIAAVPSRAFQEHFSLDNMQHNVSDCPPRDDDVNDDSTSITNDTEVKNATHTLQEHNKSGSPSTSNHSGYVIEYLGQYDDTESDEKKQYWQPAVEEEALKSQLKMLKVDEIPDDGFQVEEFLGSGQFGVVHHGKLTGTGERVAMKSITEEVNEASELSNEELKKEVTLLQEAATMGQFKHPNIIKILGVHTSSQPYMIICELMKKGDLRRHLCTKKIQGSSNLKKKLKESGVTLLSYSRQVANAMVYLSGIGYIHRDLAARNILLSMDEAVCKISDFGLSRKLENKNYYRSKNGSLFPIRWTAPEAIQESKFSTASDIWSYGVLLYEIWSLASKPYGKLKNEEVLKLVPQGHSLSPPPECPMEIYQIMMRCWHLVADARPTFKELQTSLQQPDNKLLKLSKYKTM